MEKIDPKYLDIPNIQFSLTSKDDKREEQYSKQRIERGFDDSETWSLRDTIALFIIPRMKAFKEMKFCHPPDMTMDEWNVKIGKMIRSFELVDKSNIGFLTDEETEEYREGMNLFTEYFMDLWW